MRQTFDPVRYRRGPALWGLPVLIGVVAIVAVACGNNYAAPEYATVATPAPTATAETHSLNEAAEPARPSNPGGPGNAVNLVGNVQSGQQVFATHCAVCHGNEGKGGVPNPGSDDGTVPSLNPIDPTIANTNQKTFAVNVDLFVQHGSTAEGDNPAKKMPAWGDTNALTQQQIADVIAYIISLNKH